MSKSDAHDRRGFGPSVRAILAPLSRLADGYGCAVLAVRHLNKSRGNRSIYAGQGSIDFTAAARSVLLAGCYLAPHPKAFTSAGYSTAATPSQAIPLRSRRSGKRATIRRTRDRTASQAVVFIVQSAALNAPDRRGPTMNTKELTASLGILQRVLADPRLEPLFQPTSNASRHVRGAFQERISRLAENGLFR